MSRGRPVPGPVSERDRCRADQGAAAVEMALVLPLLLLLVFGIIDFGRLLNQQITVTEAAREGARVASFGGDPAPRARLVAGDDVQVALNQRCSGPDLTRDAEVTVTHRFTFVTPVGLLGGGFDGAVTLTGRGVMPCQ
ncbi:TadE family protein [Micromonospora mirobrigensis]|uniref:TadE family protein n=1 Tax=Micromonospora mirobrigensis TaxID=262898 RepID=UPI00316ACFA1